MSRIRRRFERKSTPINLEARNSVLSVKFSENIDCKKHTFLCGHLHQNLKNCGADLPLSALKILQARKALQIAIFRKKTFIGGTGANRRCACGLRAQPSLRGAPLVVKSFKSSSCNVHMPACVSRLALLCACRRLRKGLFYLMFLCKFHGRDS
jgi:hypothetical protein